MPLTGYVPNPQIQAAYLGTPPTSTVGYGGLTPEQYDAILNANTAARTSTVTTPGGQTFTTSDPNYSLGQFYTDAMAGPAFRSPQQMQDWATANGTPLSAADLNAYTQRYNQYQYDLRPANFGIRGWMRDHPLGVIAAFGAAALGGAAAGGYFGGGAGAGAGAAGTGGVSAVGTGAPAAGSIGATAAGPIGATGAGGVASSSLPEIVVTGTTGGGIGGGGAAALGAGAAGVAGNALGTSAGTSTGPTNYGQYGGMQPNSGLGAFENGGAGGVGQYGGGNAGVLGSSGGISGGAGTGGTTGGALGNLSGAANSISGVGGSNMAGSWTDWIGPAINAGLAIYGQGQANNATDRATRAANAEQARQFDLVRSDTAPARALGAAAIDRLATLNGYKSPTGTPDMTAFYTSPDYTFNLQQTQQAVDRSAAAHNGLLSGAAVKEGMRTASGLASREYGAYVDRLLQQAGLGNTGIGASAAAGANAANNISANTINAGNQRASGYLNTAANVGNAINQGYSNYMLQRYLGG